ncbi:exocyst complex component EXO84A [Humulus lupulus]|uniref:exocyst complex component EXO84A n=1 Tax=Humulus lupulus TaxID=3486 RepID=UPI002B40D0AF|nr:exocyst complex component EXO84A [Humulus lupulus]
MDSSTFSSISRGSSLGDSSELDAHLSLSDRLKAFKTSHFDPDAYITSKCYTMNEKEIRHLCSNLVDLKKASAEEMRKSVYANYGAFIRTSKEISDLEGQLLSMRNLLSSQAAFVHSLAEGVRLDSLSSDQEDSALEDTSEENIQHSKMKNWLVEFLDTLEVLLAEKRVDEALAALDEGEKIVEEANQRQALNTSSLLSLQAAVSEQRQKLAEQLAETMSLSSIHGVELRLAVLALKKLGDGPRAHTLLLNSHQQRLQSSVQSFRSPSNLCGGVYATAVSQLVFSTIAQAVNDSMLAFGEEPAYTSELVTWGVKQTEALALHLKRHVLVSSAASGSLRVAAECVQVCLGYCSLLEARGLALSSVLLRLFRPFIEQTFSASLKKIEQSSAALAAADDWSLVYLAGTRPVGSAMSVGGPNAFQPKLSSSAHKFSSMVQDFIEDAGPLESLQMDNLTLEGMLQVFNSYVNLLINALPGSIENDNLEGFGNKIVKLAETEAQQIALLANASVLADEILPRAALKLMPLQQQTNRSSETPRKAPSDRQNRVPEQREMKKRLQRAVDRLRDSFCRQHALDLIFTEDGDTHLCAQMYTNMDSYADEPEWFPSPIFQELFVRLTRIASIASDMFVGRERFATVLLIRLSETLILWLSNDQNFWEEIESGPQPLGPLGLQQFYLDMEFVMLFCSQGRYLSRNLHQVIKDIIGRAMQAVYATGIDPQSVLPEDDWFAEVAQIAIKMLSGKANLFGNGERDVTSPTSSSIYFHGSNLE